MCMRRPKPEDVVLVIEDSHDSVDYVNEGGPGGGGEGREAECDLGAVCVCVCVCVDR
jgi:hypothetical protein